MFTVLTVTRNETDLYLNHETLKYHIGEDIIYMSLLHNHIHNYCKFPGIFNPYTAYLHVYKQQAYHDNNNDIVCIHVHNRIHNIIIIVPGIFRVGLW